jgi:hypothetical protein
MASRLPALVSSLLLFGIVAPVALLVWGREVPFTAAAVVGELGLGLGLGMLAAAPLWAAVLGGALWGRREGAGFAMLGAGLVFFGGGLERDMIVAFGETFHALPAGTAGAALWAAPTAATAAVVGAGARIGLGSLGVVLSAELLAGILSRAAPGPGLSEPPRGLVSLVGLLVGLGSLGYGVLAAASQAFSALSSLLSPEMP